MRRLLFLALFVFALAAPAFAHDAVKVDPSIIKSSRKMRDSYGQSSPCPSRLACLFD